MYLLAYYFVQSDRHCMSSLKARFKTTVKCVFDANRNNLFTLATLKSVKCDKCTYTPVAKDIGRECVCGMCEMIEMCSDSNGKFYFLPPFRFVPCCSSNIRTYTKREKWYSFRE